MAIQTFYSFDKVMSYNAQFNFCVGGRSIGKTYGMQKKTINAAIKSCFVDGEFVPGVCDQFVYVRRYKEELSFAKDTYFAAVSKEFPNWDFKTQGRHAFMAHKSTRDEKKRAWEIIGYFVALSSAQSYKSASFPRVKTIIFDEFILEKSVTQYLPNEAKIFKDLYSTIDRYTDKTRVFFLANAVSIANPYFIEYKIDPDKADANGFIKIGNGFAIIHFIDDDQFKKEVSDTRFGKFIEGTDYADFAITNVFKDNNKQLIEKKTSRSKVMFILETSTMMMSVWFDMVTGIYYMETRIPNNETIITIDPNKMDDGKRLMGFSDKPLSMLRTAFRQNRMFFDAPPIKIAFLEVMKR